ncbi:MAG: RNA polymerase sigma factor [Pseudomonadota bacterium]
MQAACAGDHSAFEELVSRHETPLYRFLVARLGHASDAQDVLQEAFAAAWRYRDSYRPRWRFSTWLYRIALRHGLRLRDTGGAEHTAQVSLDEVELTAPGSTDRLEMDIWSFARQHLSSTAFTTVWLHYHEQWKLAEIAACLGQPVSWVKVTLHRARKRLARLLNQRGQRAAL